MHIAEATGGTGDDGKAYEGPVADHAIVAIRDGSLLAAMYGQFSNDRVLVPTMPEEWKCYKYRTFVVRSTDRGKTGSIWPRWPTIRASAWRASRGRSADTAGRRDPVLHADRRKRRQAHAALPAARMMTARRSAGANRRPGCVAQCLPHGERGACLHVRQARTGLAFSLRQRKWTLTGHFCLYSGPTTSYNSVEEVAPGKLLVVYDRRQLDPSGNMRSEIVGTVVTIQRQ